MKELSYIERVYNNLNTAFSINFMVLQNLARINVASGNVFTRNDIFGAKSSAEKQYDDYFKEYAEIRNDYFEEIREFFAAETYFNSFNTNAHYLIDEYNACFEKNLQVKDVFSDRNVKNWKLFNQIFDDVENFEAKSSIDTLKLHCAFAQFLIFYDSYKKWLSAYEIFEVLERDITSYGGKSLYHGKPDNDDIFILNFDIILVVVG